MFDVDPAESLPEELEQRDLVVGTDGEVAVAGLGGDRHEAPVDPMQDRRAQSGAGGDERGIAIGVGSACPQRVQFPRRQHRHGARHGLEVVQQLHVGGAGRRRHLVAPHPPRHVGHRGLAVQDRTGDAETDAIDGDGAMPRQIGTEQGRQPVERQRRDGLDVDETRARRCGLEEADERLRPSDIGGEDHRVILVARLVMCAASSSGASHRCVLLPTNKLGLRGRRALRLGRRAAESAAHITRAGH